MTERSEDYRVAWQEAEDEAERLREALQAAREDLESSMVTLDRIRKAFPRVQITTSGDVTTCEVFRREGVLVFSGVSRDALLVEPKGGRSGERSDGRDEMVKWLVEVLHYPFDMFFDPPPPIDHDAVADYWNESDGWGVSAEEARALVREEAGL